MACFVSGYWPSFTGNCWGDIWIGNLIFFNDFYPFDWWKLFDKVFVGSTDLLFIILFIVPKPSIVVAWLYKYFSLRVVFKGITSSSAFYFLLGTVSRFNFSSGIEFYFPIYAFPLFGISGNSFSIIILSIFLSF